MTLNCRSPGGACVQLGREGAGREIAGDAWALFRPTARGILSLWWMFFDWLARSVTGGLPFTAPGCKWQAPSPSAPKHLILVWCLSPQLPWYGHRSCGGISKGPWFGGCQSQGCACWMFLAPAGEPGGHSLYRDLQSVFWILGSWGAAGISHLGWEWEWQPLRKAGWHLLSCRGEYIQTLWPAPRRMLCFWKCIRMIIGVFYAVSPNWEQPTVHQHL